ncbi:L-threonylcarbamoyladenylate synthase [Spiroplasma endosymbiont of Labia minor]|uniref:L-threonylcarbamoyladenylate synthase n=1 Tax=Spiroplasma endosymbiont of Labia minor TaxID=3066305 RepID=UPI0030D1BDD9
MKMMTQEQINIAIKQLKNNELIILPTDTIYGISAIFTDKNKIKINNLKKSDLNKPLIILVSSLIDAKKIIDLNDLIIDKLTSSKPTTVIAKAKHTSENIGIRIVNRNDIKKIIKEVGPIFSTSVNVSGNHFLFEEIDLNNFSSEIKNVFWVGNLDRNPSQIYEIITNSKKR